jgi:uncharacterized protein YqgC (DUF456 family)
MSHGAFVIPSSPDGERARLSGYRTFGRGCCARRVEEGVDTDLLVLVIVALGALAATGFTVVPVLPGTLFVPAGAAIIGLATDFGRFEWWFWAAQAMLVIAYVAIDNVAQVFGVKRLGGSRQAMFGGAVGVFLGPILLAFVMGPFALLLGPPIGAVVGTLVGEHRARRTAETDPAVEAASYRRLGMGALTAFVVGTILKLVIVAIQVTLLVAAAR